MTIEERLRVWIKGLSEAQKDEIILELTEFAIDAEHVAFYSNTKVPYYDNTGENVDGTEDVD